MKHNEIERLRAVLQVIADYYSSSGYIGEIAADALENKGSMKSPADNQLRLRDQICPQCKKSSIPNWVMLQHRETGRLLRWHTSEPIPKGYSVIRDGPQSPGTAECGE